MLIKNKKGMTILELMIASLVLSIGLLGYTSTKMKSIFDAEHSSNFSFIATSTSDFQSIVQSELRSKIKTEDKKELLDKYYDYDWSSNDYNQHLKNCDSTKKIENIDYCDEDMMLAYNIKTLKNTIIKEVPDARFDMVSCNSGSSSCLIVSWLQSSLTLSECKNDTVSCYIMEF